MRLLDFCFCLVVQWWWWCLLTQWNTFIISTCVSPAVTAWCILMPVCHRLRRVRASTWIQDHTPGSLTGLVPPASLMSLILQWESSTFKPFFYFTSLLLLLYPVCLLYFPYGIYIIFPSDSMRFLQHSPCRRLHDDLCLPPCHAAIINNNLDPLLSISTLSSSAVTQMCTQWPLCWSCISESCRSPSSPFTSMMSSWRRPSSWAKMMKWWERLDEFLLYLFWPTHWVSHIVFIQVKFLSLIQGSSERLLHKSSPLLFCGFKASVCGYPRSALLSWQWLCCACLHF